MDDTNIIKEDIQHFEKDTGKGLKKMIKKFRKAGKRTKIIIGIILVVVLIIIGWVVFKEKESPYTLAKVVRSDVIQEVSATGTVEAAEEVDLRFKSSGVIASINVKVGQQVKKGVYLVQLSAGDVQSQYQQAVASYNQAKAKLDQLLAGATTQEIKVAEQVVENAQIALDDAKAKADNDLEQDYNSALVYLVDASSNCNKAIADLKDVEKAYFYESTTLVNTFKEKRGRAENAFLGIPSLGIKGAKDFVDEAVNNPSHENIDGGLTEIKTAIQKIIDVLDYTKTAMSDPAIRENVSSADKTTINTDITNTNTTYSNINTAITNISNQKITNQTNTNTAESTYKKAQADLEELLAPPRGVDIAVFQADVDKYRANMNEFAQKLRDASIIAPFDGVVAKLDAKIGQVVSANDKVVVSLISPGNFQIRADISEADIEKLDLEDSVAIVLDAFPEETLTGQIVEIEPGETIVDGVVYYRIKIFFENITEKIRSGMTVDATIQTDKKENVLNIPQRAIVYSDDKTFVRILDGKEVKEVQVKTGLKGSNGEIEIVSGLNDGEEVITFIKK